MKVTRKGSFAFVEEITPLEISLLIQTLRWEDWDKEEITDSEGNVYTESVIKTFSLIFKCENTNKLYFYYNFCHILPKVSTLKIEILNEPTFEMPNYKLDKSILDGIELYDEQFEALKRLLYFREGICKIATSGGKSEIQLALLKHRLLDKEYPLKSAIVLVPSIYLAEDFYERAINYGFSPSDIGMIGGEKYQIAKRIKIIVMKSALNMLKSPPRVKTLRDADTLLVDEAHTLKSEEHRRIFLLNNGRYKLAFTATPFQNYENPISDYRDSVMMGLCGKVLVNITSSDLIALNRVAKPIVFMKPTGAKKLPSNVKMDPLIAKLKFISHNKKRNNLIIEISKKVLKIGFNLFITANTKQQAEYLLTGIGSHKAIAKYGGVEATRLVRGEVKKFKIHYEEWRHNFESGEYDLLIGTPSLFQGMNLPAIGFMIVGSGALSNRMVRQKKGRSVRKKQVGPNQVYLVDFIDTSTESLLRHSHERIKYYYEDHSDFKQEEEFWEIVENHAKQLGLKPRL